MIVKDYLNNIFKTMDRGERMIVKDYLNNIFETMDNRKVGQDIFNFVDSDLLDKYYINMYGNRTLSNIATNLTVEELADVLNNMFSSKWNNIILNYLDSENLLTNYKETITELSTNNITTDNTRNDTNKVSAYNDVDFVNSNENMAVENMVTGNKGNKETIRTKIKEVDFYDKVNKYLTDFNIYNIMIIDINSVVTLNILN
jgi:hypothetical protein